MRKLLFVVAIFIFAVTAKAAPTKFITSTSCGSSPGCTTSAMNNTAVGSTGLMVIGVSSFNDTSTATVSCANPTITSFSHTADYTSTTGIHTAIFYLLAPSVGSSQTCSVSNGGYTSIFVETFSNVGALHGTATGAGSTGTTVQPGSQTPSIGDLAISCVGSFPATPSVSTPFFINGSMSGASQADGACAFTQATTTTALNPTWTNTGSSTGSSAAMILFAGSSGSGSASLSLSSPVLNSDGKTLTSTISGGTCPLSPTSGVTGISIYSGGVPLYINSVTTSSCTLTANLGSSQQLGDVITMDLVGQIFSNLTDASGNTPSQQFGVSVTNNSTQVGITASTSTTNIYPLGKWTTASGIATPTSAPSASLEFSCSNSTDAQILGPSTGIEVQTDGGSYINITPLSSGYSWQPLATGLTVGTHKFKVITSSVTASNSIRCSGPTSASLTPISGYAGGTFYQPQATPYTTGVTNFGAPTNTNSTIGGIAYASANGGFARTGNPSFITIYTFGNGDSVELYKDNVLISTTTVPNDSTYDAVVLATGLSGTHTYRTAFQGSGGNKLLSGLITDDTLTGNVIPAPINIDACGDSITVGFGIPGQFQFIDFWLSTYKLGNGVGIGDQFQGKGGWQVYGTGGTTDQLSTWCPILTLGSVSNALWLNGGVNDMIDGVSLSNFGTAELAMITNSASAPGMMAPGGKIFVRSILPTNAANSANRSSFNSTTQTQVASYNAGSPTYPAIYIPTDNWLDVTNPSLWLDGVTTPALHPNATGYAVIANLETPINASLIGSSYTLSCPSTGKIGIPITCTVSLQGGATWTTLSAGVSPAETLTLSVSGISGTFSKSSPWNPAAGGNSDTFTFTPSSSGIGTISTSATSAGWADPSGISITISGPVAIRSGGVCSGGLGFCN